MSAYYWQDFICVNVAPLVTVAFDSRDGSAVSPQTILPNEKAVKPTNPTRSGYIVAGWYKDSTYSNEWNFDTDIVTANMTLYAKWIKGYLVTWNTDGGVPTPTQTSVVDGGSITAPNGMTKAGYTFGGWYSNAGLTVEAAFPLTSVTESKTFYAKWISSAVTNITGIPNTIAVGNLFTLSGTVVPTDATNTMIVWDVADAGTTSAEIYGGNRLIALSDGIVVLKATIVNGISNGTNYEQLFTITVGSTDAVLFNDRAISQSNQ